MNGSPLKPVVWVGSSLRDLTGFSQSVKDDVGHALHEAQQGQLPGTAKVLKGFGGASVVEIVARDADGTYRAAYTVRFSTGVYVLHVFKKKSKSGIATPKNDIAMIRSRLALAEELHKETLQ